MQDHKRCILVLLFFSLSSCCLGDNGDDDDYDDDGVVPVSDSCVRSCFCSVYYYESYYLPLILLSLFFRLFVLIILLLVFFFSFLLFLCLFSSSSSSSSSSCFWHGCRLFCNLKSRMFCWFYWSLWNFCMFFLFLSYFLEVLESSWIILNICLPFAKEIRVLGIFSQAGCWPTGRINEQQMRVCVVFLGINKQFGRRNHQLSIHVDRLPFRRHIFLIQVSCITYVRVLYVS